MLLNLQHAPVLVDLALTEGGNVECSEHDQVIVHLLLCLLAGYVYYAQQQGLENLKQPVFHFLKKTIGYKSIE